ncbi:MAG: mechanosensitive ion channel protein MscS [Salinarimonadaceae bacterium]|nr:MAG: mechanosensitive ion channel protein MscS [Salinarimonadaceae bacterium]
MRRLTFARFLPLVVLLAVWLAVPASASAQLLPPQAAASEPATSGETAPADAQTQALIDLLEDDSARARLIERLRGEAAAPGVAEQSAESVSVARLIAERTRDVAENISGVFGVAAEFAGAVATLWRDASSADVTFLARVLWTLGIVMAATLSVFFALRLVTDRMRRGFSDKARASGLMRRLALAPAAIGIDAASVLVAWIIGFVLAANVATNEIMGLNAALFLNAFLVAEGLKVAVRGVFMPHCGALRFLPIGDTTANYWYFWLSRVVSLLVYAFLFIAPIVTWNLTAASGQAIRALAVFTACMIGIVLVLQNKALVRELLMRRVARGQKDALGRMSQALAQLWHILAIGYLLVAFFVWVADPRTAIEFMAAATFKSVVAIAVGVLIFGFVSRVISGGMRLSDDVRKRLPLLETRLNAFVPKVLHVVRVVVVAAVVMAIAAAWEVFDFVSWATSGVGLAITTSLLSAGLILLGGFVLYVVMSSWVEYRLNPDYGTPATARERTLLSLFRNAFTVTLCVVVAIMVLSEIGVNIAPLLAGAGVVGLAVGFGAQKLVQDVITGVFIQLENAMNEGDVVTAGGVSGVVERLTIRSVSMRDLSGVYHVIPFSSVDMVSNSMRNFSYHVAEIGVDYKSDIPSVKQAMADAFDRLAADPDHAPNIIGPYEMHGVTQFADSAIVVRGRIKTLPGKQWGTGRAYNEYVKAVFDERGIEIPFPHVTYYSGDARANNAPPFSQLPPSEGTRPDDRQMVETAHEETGAAGAETPKE